MKTPFIDYMSELITIEEKTAARPRRPHARVNVKQTRKKSKSKQHWVDFRKNKKRTGSCGATSSAKDVSPSAPELDERVLITINHFVNARAQANISTILPDYRIVYGNRRRHQVNPINFAILVVLQRLIHLDVDIASQPLEYLLDVGFNMQPKNQRFAIIDKTKNCQLRLHELKVRHSMMPTRNGLGTRPILLSNNNALHFHARGTYCTCGVGGAPPAQGSAKFTFVCPHISEDLWFDGARLDRVGGLGITLGQKPVAAVFCQTYHEYAPEDISRLVRNTANGRAYVITHILDGTTGDIDGEFDWKRINENEYVIVNRANNVSYRHRNMRNFDGLIFTKMNQINTYALYKVDYIPDSRLEFEKAYTLEDYSELANDEALMDKHGVYTGKTVGTYNSREFYKFKVGRTTLYHPATQRVIPIKILTEVTQFYMKHDFSKESWQAAYQRACSMATKRRAGLNYSTADLLDSIPIALLYATLKKLSMTDDISKCHRPAYDVRKRMYNKAVIDGEYPFLPYSYKFLGMLFVVTMLTFYMFKYHRPDIDFKFLISTALPYWTHAILIACTIAVCLILPRFNRMIMWLMMFFGKSAALDEVVSLNISHYYTIAICFIIVLIMRYIYHKPKTKYALWYIWLQMYYDRRESLPVNTPIPQDALVKGINSWINKDDYRSRPRSTLKIRVKEAPKEQEDMKPAMKPVGIVFTGLVPVVFGKSQHNTVLAFKTRVLPITDFTPSTLAWASHVINISHLLPVVHGSYGPIPSIFVDTDYVEPSYDDFIDRYPPAKKRNFQMHEERVKLDIAKFNLNYSAFTKCQKELKVSQDVYISSRPRMIQAPSDTEKICSSFWFYRYGKAMKYVWHYRNQVWFAAGRTSSEYKQWFEYHVNRMGGVDNCVFIGSDFSAFDATQGELCKTNEHNWYRSLGFVTDIDQRYGDGIAEAILDARERLTVYTSDDIKCKYTYCRQSGQPDTTNGNSKITGDVIIGALASVNIEEEDRAIAVCGDDNFSIINKQVWNDSKIPLIHRYCNDLGFKLKIQVSENPTSVEFISCRFLPVKEGYALSKKPGRVLSKMGWMLYKPCRSMKQWRALLKGSMLSYTATGLHVPFLRIYLNKMFEELKDVVADTTNPSLKYRIEGKERYTCNKATFEAMYEVYGLTKKDEERFSKQLDKIKEFPYLLNSREVKLMASVDTAL